MKEVAPASDVFSYNDLLLSLTAAHEGSSESISDILFQAFSGELFTISITSAQEGTFRPQASFVSTLSSMPICSFLAGSRWRLPQALVLACCFLARLKCWLPSPCYLARGCTRCRARLYTQASRLPLWFWLCVTAPDRREIWTAKDVKD